MATRDTELLEQLRRLVKRDTDTRARLLEEGRLYGRYDDEMQQVHRDNAVALSQLVQGCGWPNTAIVGEEGSHLAWLIAQHSICTPDLQRSFLEAFAQSVITKQTYFATAPQQAWQQLALLTDRIRFHEGRPQRYGTVFDWNDEGELDCQVEEPDTLDQRRADIGLEPFQKALEAQRVAVAGEGGQPPDDLASYREAQEHWAVSMGWRDIQNG